MSSSRQSGSIITFVVIGVVLAALLLGGLYLSKQRARTVANTAAPSQTQTETEQTNTQKPDTKPAAESETKPQTTTPPAETKPQTATQPAARSAVPQTGPSSIAATGSEDSVIVRAIIVLALGLSIASYTVSRRELLVTALR